MEISITAGAQGAASLPVESPPGPTLAELVAQWLSEHHTYDYYIDLGDAYGYRDINFQLTPGQFFQPTLPRVPWVHCTCVTREAIAIVYGDKAYPQFDNPISAGDPDFFSKFEKALERSHKMLCQASHIISAATKAVQG